MEEWRKIRLGDACVTNKNSYSPKEGWGFVNYLDTGNITNNRIDSIQYIDMEHDKLPSRARRKVKKNSIIYSTVRPNQRHFGIIKTPPENFLVSTGFTVIDVDNNVLDADFLYYLLTQSVFVEALHAIAEQSTSAYPSIKPSDIEDLEIEIPDLDTQKKIASVLGSMDKKVVQNTEVNNHLEQLVNALFKAYFTNNPSLYKMTFVPLSDLCVTVTKGTTPTTLGKPYTDTGINFIKAESILNNHIIDKSKFAYIDDETNQLLKRSILRDRDIVFTIAGTLGRFALIDETCLPANTNQAVAIIRVDTTKVMPEYIYASFIGQWHIDYYTKRIQQAVQANLSLTTIKSLPIPLLNESDMRIYMHLITPVIKTIANNNIQNEKLSSVRDALLPELMSGELDVSALDL